MINLYHDKVYLLFGVSSGHIYSNISQFRKGIAVVNILRGFLIKGGNDAINAGYEYEAYRDPGMYNMPTRLIYPRKAIADHSNFYFALNTGLEFKVWDAFSGLFLINYNLNSVELNVGEGSKIKQIPLSLSAGVKYSL